MSASKEELRGLQADLNFFAEKVGYDLVKVDGVVGPKTLAAAQKVHDAVVAEKPMLGATIPKPDSVEAIVGLAPMYRVWLEGSARKTLDVGDLRRYHKGSGKDWNTKDTSLGFDKLTTDGFIGAKTAAAVKKVYDAVVAKNPLLAVTLFPVPDTKEEAAEYAQFIRSWLGKTASKNLLAEQA